MASWRAHINRGTPSQEPGTDFYCPPGTPVLAPADGEIWGYGESVIPATGRWVGVNFANGMSFRCMHHSELRRRSGRVFQGDVLALSGSSGYGSEYFGEPWRNAAFFANTGGDHTHVTLWPTWDHRYGYRSPGVPYTIDFMQHVDASLAGGGSTPFEEDDMTPEQEELLQAAATNAAEARRMAGVLLGALDKGTDAEGRFWQRLNDLQENAAEARRQGGVVLGVLPPAGNELRPVGGDPGVLDDAALTAIAKAAAEGARTGGEAGAKAAIAALTLVAKSS